MTARNDVTFDTLITRPASPEYRANYSRIFAERDATGRKPDPESLIKKALEEEVQRVVRHLIDPDVGFDAEATLMLLHLQHRNLKFRSSTELDKNGQPDFPVADMTLAFFNTLKAECGETKRFQFSPEVSVRRCKAELGDGEEFEATIYYRPR